MLERVDWARLRAARLRGQPARGGAVLVIGRPPSLPLEASPPCGRPLVQCSAPRSKISASAGLIARRSDRGAAVVGPNSAVPLLSVAPGAGYAMLGRY